jgi:nitrite reductase/ring-hydroxylating ferredoxin subunit
MATGDAHECGAWHDAAALDTLSRRGALAVKLHGRQIALFLHDGTPRACNNRCPHEGYPLAEGTLDATGCVLTCHWHNWTFDLRDGANLYGGDRLRVYPARIAHGRVEVDLRDPPPAERIAAALAQLDDAMADNDRPRIARELARAEKAGTTVEQVLAQAIARQHERFRYGMTHAHAAAEAWLRLRDDLTDPAARLASAAEALGSLSFDALREPAYPYTPAVAPWDATAFLAAVEAQDEGAALARLHGALDAGLGVDDLLPVLVAAALAHYNDFGHSLIYLLHLRRLVARVGNAAQRPLLRLWLRALRHATREDLLPDFRAYADVLASWPMGQGDAGAPPLRAADFEALSIRRTLVAVGAQAAQPPQRLLAALVQAAAHHLLRFDAAVAQRTDNPVADNIGWLDFSHALTFAQALVELLPADSPLWPQGLLQLALFVGRNTPYLDAGVDTAAALARWRVDDAAAFAARWRAQVVDHGQALDIFAAHWLKTSLAVEALVGPGAFDDLARPLRAAQNRLLAARFKPRHALRNAQQALAFVARED